jgi:hypothetical protein
VTQKISERALIRVKVDLIIIDFEFQFFVKIFLGLNLYHSVKAMPFLQINTNLPKEKITEELSLRLTDVLAATTNKPKDYCVVHILPGNFALKKAKWQSKITKKTLEILTQVYSILKDN